MFNGVSDTEVIQRVLKGDQRSYSELVNRYQRYVFTIALKYIPAREDAEEVAQDVFIKAYKHLADYRESAGRFSTWLYTITYNTSISFLRKKKLPMAYADEEKHAQQLENIPSHHTNDRMEQKSKEQMLEQAMKSLPEDDHLILTLFYKADQSLEEISKILKVETNTAKVRLHRARQKLREKLETQWSNELKHIL
jgi:RNA polymerase sigma factor (sigma-70 family)